MNFLCILFVGILVTFCKGLPIQSSPNHLEITTFGDKDKSWFTLKWNKLIEADDADPTLGYKVKIWEVEKIIKRKYSVIDGKFQETEVKTLPNMELNRDPPGKVTVIEVPPNENETKYEGVKIGSTYEVGVQAYTAKGDQPFSSKMRIKLNEN